MDAERWKQIKEMLGEALSLPDSQREDFLRGRAAGNSDLVQEALTLLEMQGASGTIGVTVGMSAVSDEEFIGAYRLIRQIGDGGMGVVYHAQQKQPIRRDVALKVIKPGMDSKQIIARFESERQALALMDHSNIARVFEAGATSSGRPYFVMELVNGVPITQYCDAKRLTLRGRIELFIPVCQAIQHAHQKGVIHRDIKPSNLLVAEEEGRPVPKVIDFGLAKALGPHWSDATMLTNPGTVLGTLEYMSPEQAEFDRQDIDTRSDLYSLGAVLYELLTGTTPLEHERLADAGYLEVLQRIRQEEPPPPSVRWRRTSSSIERASQRSSEPARLPKLLDGELDWIVMKALEKDRARRYETVNGLTRDLERYLQGEPVEAGPPSAAYRVRKLVGRYRVWLVAAAAFLALLVAGVVVSSSMALRARRAEETARAVDDFLQNDLLAQASSNNQARPGARPDPDLKVRTALDRAAARVEGKFPSQPLVEAAIRQTIGRTYTDLGLYADAQRQVERALELRRRALGEKHPETLASANLLAELYSRQTQYARAEPLYADTLEKRRRVLGEDHPDTLASMNGLAVVYLFEAKFAQAEILLARLLEARKRVLGLEHPDTLSTMNNLALEYLDLSKYEQAQALNRQVLEIRRRVLGAEHPLTLMSMNNLATSYKENGKYAEAEPLYSEALAIQRRVSGKEHPDTLTVMANLAELYEAERKFALAEPLYSEALDAQRRRLGPDHRDTLYTLNSMASLYFTEGKYPQAEKLFAEVWQSRREVLGENHPDTLRTLIGLGWSEIRQGKNAEAESHLRAGLKGYQSANSSAWEQYENQALLGISLAAQARYAEAESLLSAGCRGLMDHQASVSAEDRPALEEGRQALVRLYRAQGQSAKAAAWQ